MLKRPIFRSLGLLAMLSGGTAPAGSENAAAGKIESTEMSVCRLIESSARTQSLPVAFLTRLIWQESSFRPNAISPAGAQGVAQFMPRTAGERGLANPFDPEEAIPKSAELLAGLKQRFGNLGLAAAAYNAGPSRVANWLAGYGNLPAETRGYVLSITRHPVEDWTGGAAAETMAGSAVSSKQSCLQTTAAIRRSVPRSVAASALFAPWGVQLAGSFSKAAALAAYTRARSSYSAIIGKVEPMVIGGRVRSRGFATYYQVRAPAPSRAAADALCEKILHAGGACAVLRS
ncbi:MAG: lytic transglycosylase domain-containing protein [Beijerinckiaceae bacterium]